MSKYELRIGQQVRYPNGFGKIISIKNSNEIIDIKTKSKNGVTRIFPSDLPFLKPKMDCQ